MGELLSSRLQGSGTGAVLEQDVWEDQEDKSAEDLRKYADRPHRSGNHGERPQADTLKVLY